MVSSATLAKEGRQLSDSTKGFGAKEGQPLLSSATWLSIRDIRPGRVIKLCLIFIGIISRQSSISYNKNRWLYSHHLVLKRNYFHHVLHLHYGKPSKTGNALHRPHLRPQEKDQSPWCWFRTPHQKVRSLETPPLHGIRDSRTSAEIWTLSQDRFQPCIRKPPFLDLKADPENDRYSDFSIPSWLLLLFERYLLQF